MVIRIFDKYERIQDSGKFIEEARVVIPYIKGLSEQYIHTLTKCKVKSFFKGTSTIKSLLMCPKGPIQDYQKTDLKGIVSNHRNQTTSTIRNNHISTIHPKAEIKDFTIIGIDSNTLHHCVKEAPHICIKDPSCSRNIGKVRIPFSIQQTSQTHTQLEHPHSFILPLKGSTFFPWSFNMKDNQYFMPS